MFQRTYLRIDLLPAVAYYGATGKDELLNIREKTDLICRRVFIYTAVKMGVWIVDTFLES